MGPKIRYLGDDVPAEVLAWQDPLPERDYKLVSDSDIRSLEAAIATSGLTPARPHGLGICLNFPRYGYAWRCQRRACSPRTAESVGD